MFISWEESEYQSESEGSDLSFLATDLAEQVTETARIVEEATRSVLSLEIEEQRNRIREEVSIESSEDVNPYSKGIYYSSDRSNLSEYNTEYDIKAEIFVSDLIKVIKINKENLKMSDVKDIKIGGRTIVVST